MLLLLLLLLLLLDAARIEIQFVATETGDGVDPHRIGGGRRRLRRRLRRRRRRLRRRRRVDADPSLFGSARAEHVGGFGALEQNNDHPVGSVNEVDLIDFQRSLH